MTVGVERFPYINKLYLNAGYDFEIEQKIRALPSFSFISILIIGIKFELNRLIELD